MEIQAGQVTFRSYLFFWSGQLVSLLGSSIAQFVIIWWITLETGSALYLSVASFLGLVPYGDFDSFCWCACRQMEP